MSRSTSSVYVWAWLPGEGEPVPAGVLSGTPDSLSFRYGNRYLERPNAISLSPTLPLGEERFAPTGEMALPSAIRDAAPDAWGRRAILSRLTGARGFDAETADLPERTYLLESSSNRIGALDFQESAVDYVPRGEETAQFGELQDVADRISSGEAVPPELHAAMLSGTGIGGARPKALVTIGGKPSLVKFTVSTDVFPSIQAEALASKLAERAGLRTPRAAAMRIGGKYALVTERFDREGAARRMMVSGLTLSGRDELASRYGSYPELLSRLVGYSDDPESVGRELFERIAFNIAISNNDEHLRNHAAFWNGTRLELTPAYDLAPAARREGAEISLTLPYGPAGEKIANLKSLIAVARTYSLSGNEARASVDRICTTIEGEIDDAADEMQIGSGDLEIIRSSFLHDTATRGFVISQ